MRLSRKQSKRMWYAGLVTLWLFPFVLVPWALAGSAEVLPPGSAQGWFWRDRPLSPQPVNDPTTGDQITTTPDLYTTPLAVSGRGYGGGLAEADWPGDHLYVGWDGAKKEIEMLSGVAFSLDGTVPSGSVITRFELTVLEHPAGTDPPHKTTVGVNGSGSRNAMLAQGIVACPWPDFYGGSRAAPMSAATQRDCSKAVVGQPTVVPATDAFTSSTLVTWKFDLSSMAANWADENAAFSLEPNPDPEKQQTVSWRTTFHQSGYSESGTPKPGVYATVEWREGDAEGESFEETFGDLSGGSFSPGFESGLVENLSEPPPAEEAPPPLAAGVFEGNPADFWDIPLSAWAAAIIGVGFLAASARALQQDSLNERPPGAASALMRDRNMKAQVAS